MTFLETLSAQRRAAARGVAGARSSATMLVCSSALLGAMTFLGCNSVPEPEGKSKPAASSNDPTELKIEDLAPGTGDRVVKDGDAILVTYKGTLLRGGKQFDANTDKDKAFPVTVGKGEVIKGWDQGLLGMKKGGKRKLTIPASLAYGEAGHPPDIPKNAPLVFEIELVRFGDEPAPAPSASASASAAPSTSADAPPAPSGSASAGPTADPATSASAKASAKPAGSAAPKASAGKPAP